MNFVQKSLSALALSAALASPAWASNGTFDFLDPCVKATDDFRAERASVLTQLDQAVADADHAPPSDAYRSAWMRAKKSQARPTFDSLVAPMLREAGMTDMDAAYDKWFAAQLKAVGDDKVGQLVTASFHQELKQVRIDQHAQGEAQLLDAQNELDHSCKMDVGNQALRATLTTVMAPVAMISRNLELAKRESGVGAQIVAGTTGISVTDFVKYGPAGGPGSEVNKAGAVIAKVFGW